MTGYIMGSVGPQGAVRYCIRIDENTHAWEKTGIYWGRGDMESSHYYYYYYKGV